MLFKTHNTANMDMDNTYDPDGPIIGDRCFIYTRVSTRKQLEGQSLDNQLSKCREYLAKRGIEAIDEFCDKAISGRTFERKALNAMMKAAREGDFIVIYNLTRLGRDALKIGTILKDSEDRGLHIVSATERLDNKTAIGKFMIQMLSGIAEFEVNETYARTKAALDNRRKTGQLIGRLGFGFGVYKFGERRYTYPLCEEQEAITYAISQRTCDPPMGWAVLGRTMIERGWMPKEGGSVWRQSSLEKLVKDHRKSRALYGLEGIRGSELLLWERYRSPIFIDRETLLNNIDEKNNTVDYMKVFGNMYGYNGEKLSTDPEVIRRDFHSGRMNNLPEMEKLLENKYQYDADQAEKDRDETEARMKHDMQERLDSARIRAEKEEADALILAERAAKPFDLSVQDPVKVKNFRILFPNITNMAELEEKAKIFFA